MHVLKRRKVLVPLIVVGVLAVAGAAVAYWTSSGTSTGTATVGTASGLTVPPFTLAGTLYPGGPAATATVTITPVTFTGTLYPGGTAATSSITINNPGAADVQVTNLGLDTAQPTSGPQIGSGIGGLPAAGCPAADFTFNANLGGPVNVPAGGSVVVNSATLSMANTTSNQNACKGRTLTIYLAAS
ncbi:MAG: hypothetical protein MUF56_00120 [Solirubrobacteraceae bacterium]|nr:hypothetical protein [Solirubrobacteraceae bacterium]